MKLIYTLEEEADMRGSKVILFWVLRFLLTSFIFVHKTLN